MNNPWRKHEAKTPWFGPQGGTVHTQYPNRSHFYATSTAAGGQSTPYTSERSKYVKESSTLSPGVRADDKGTAPFDAEAPAFVAGHLSFRLGTIGFVAKDDSDADEDTSPAVIVNANGLQQFSTVITITSTWTGTVTSATTGALPFGGPDCIGCTLTATVIELVTAPTETVTVYGHCDSNEGLTLTAGITSFANEMTTIVSACNQTSTSTDTTQLEESIQTLLENLTAMIPMLTPHCSSRSSARSTAWAVVSMELNTFVR
ncbi:hypothetical protein DFH07DRAFT_1058387 [Mycena maculata]|uniref:Uncharacterized protein n=1 Tax=Mycena maculata TaxID=230809 RepID=A0AAD7JMP5_9AGAR|nr:hypothetical protein DFH07DRAFT_1058387 [Mycena maculata]